MFRPLGTMPAIICASAFFAGVPCFISGQSFGQTPPPPSSAPASGPVVVGEKPAGDPVPAIVPPANVAPASVAPPATAPTVSTYGSPPKSDSPPKNDSAPNNPVTVPLPAVGDPAKPPISAQPPSPSPAHALPMKDASAPFATATKPYVIGSLDVLDIKVWNAPNLSGFFEVGPDGMISMPLLGEIRGDGITKEQLTKTIREKLASTVFTEPPEVNVQVARVNSKKYYMFGGVNHQGEFPLLGAMTVLDAFANAGGFHDFANKKGIYILRADPTAKGGFRKIGFNFIDVSQGKHMEQNIQLQNGDRIFVKE